MLLPFTVTATDPGSRARRGTLVTGHGPVETPAFMTAFVALNTQKKPLDNQKVRQALNMAFDRTTYLKTVFDNTATPATNPWPPITWGYDKSIEAYPYDPAKAKQLLADAVPGYVT